MGGGGGSSDSGVCGGMVAVFVPLRTPIGNERRFHRSTPAGASFQVLPRRGAGRRTAITAVIVARHAFRWRPGICVLLPLGAGYRPVRTRDTAMAAAAVHGSAFTFAVAKCACVGAALLLPVILNASVASVVVSSVVDANIIPPLPTILPLSSSMYALWALLSLS